MTTKQLREELYPFITGYVRLPDGQRLSPEEALDAIMSAVAEHDEYVIGNDVAPYTSDSPSNNEQPIYKTENKLRAEQRGRAGL